MSESAGSGSRRSEGLELSAAVVVTEEQLSSAREWLRQAVACQVAKSEGVEVRLTFRDLVAGTADAALEELASILPAGLSGFSLHVPPTCAPTDAGLRALAGGLGASSGLLSFEIRVWGCERITKKSLEALAEALVSHVNLTDICVDFAQCDKISDGGVEAIADALQTWAYSEEEGKDGLKRLDLNFHGLSALTDTAVQKLGDSLVQLEKLTALSLSLAEVGDAVSVQGYKAIFGGIALMADLEELTFNFHRCRELLESSIMALCQALGGKEALQKVGFDFSECQTMTPAAVAFFKEPFKQSAKLRQVRFDFTRCEKINDVCLQDVSGCILEMEDVSRLTLNVGGTEVTQDAIGNVEADLRQKVPNVKISIRLPYKLTTGICLKLDTN